MKLDRGLSGETSTRMRRTVANGVYAIAEYASQPIGLLLSVPYLLRHMGAAQFGVWVLASSAVNGGNALSTGFSDAAIKYVAMYRGRGDASGVTRVVRGMLSINLALSVVIAIALWALAPLATSHIAHIDPTMRYACQLSIRVGSLLLVVRSIDDVFAGTLRAFEQYGCNKGGETRVDGYPYRWTILLKCAQSSRKDTIDRAHNQQQASNPEG